MVQHPEIRQLINIDSFSLKDWDNAINFMTEINQNKQAIELALKVLQNYSKSSFTYYLLGKAYIGDGNKKNAKECLLKSLSFDNENAETKKLLQDLNKQKSLLNETKALPPSWSKSPLFVDI